MEQLSNYFSVDVITLQDDILNKIARNEYMVAKGVRFITPGMFPVPVSKTTSFTFIQKMLRAVHYRLFYITRSPADAALVAIIPILQSIKHNHYDYILFEHLESLQAAKLLRRFFPCAKFILNAHNVDHILLKNTANKARIEKVKKIESTLYKRCNLILACSHDDQAIFEVLNHKKVPVCTVPNGVDIELNTYQQPAFGSGETKLIFCGSLDYEPNCTGLTWFLKSVWPQVLQANTHIKLLVVGKGQPETSLLALLQTTSNVELIGEVDNVIPYYRQAQGAIVPLISGSGTRLKVLEAMSVGVPVLSTTIGVEGINCNNGLSVFICNTAADSISAIASLKDKPQCAVTISKNARELVEKEYTWNVIGQNLYGQLYKLQQAT